MSWQKNPSLEKIKWCNEKFLEWLPCVYFVMVFCVIYLGSATLKLAAIEASRKVANLTERKESAYPRIWCQINRPYANFFENQHSSE